jgi:hypothetical protein
MAEPNSDWIAVIKNESNLRYDHSYIGHSSGSFLWMMDIEVDLLHLWEGGIHPRLYDEVKPDQITKYSTDDWVCQMYPRGWWTFIYPYTLVEYGGAGRLAISSVTPDGDGEFGFNWMMQFYYGPNVSIEEKILFEDMANVWDQDVEACEKIKGAYFPLKHAGSPYEEDCVSFGAWCSRNLSCS